MRSATLGKLKKGANYTLFTGLAAALLVMFLTPFLYMIFTSLKTQTQFAIVNAPIWPAMPAYYEYAGQQLEVFTIPGEEFEDGSARNLALLKKGAKESTFIDPRNPEAEPVVLQVSWRSLGRPWQFSPAWQNYAKAWNTIDFPRLLWNTAFYAIMTNVGVLISCTLVAFGFSRFRFPGRDILFLLVISTMFLPGAVTVIPTYTFFAKIGWVGTWLPLIVPAFFANAYDTFLLRQFFMTLPRELDEAAMIDGAGPFRVLWSVILPQSYAALVAVTVFHIVWAWNDYFGPLIYLSTKPQLFPISVGLTSFNSMYGRQYELIQAGALMAILLPVILFFLAQRFFVQGIVVTGVEK